MSYEDTNCPCGGKKPTDTMLCDACELAFVEHPAMKDFNNGSLGTDTRHHAAVILVTLSRKRGRLL